MYDKREYIETSPSPLAHILIGAVRLYQGLLSPLMASRCRFTPSCSSYAVDAITIYGAFRGAWLALRRVGRCHPWHQGGWDPVPSASSSPRGGTKGA